MDKLSDLAVAGVLANNGGGRFRVENGILIKRGDNRNTSYEFKCFGHFIAYQTISDVSTLSTIAKNT